MRHLLSIFSSKQRRIIEFDFKHIRRLKKVIARFLKLTYSVGRNIQWSLKVQSNNQWFWILLCDIPSKLQGTCIRFKTWNHIDLQYGNSYSTNIIRIDFSRQVSMSGQFIKINCAIVNDLEIWNTKNIAWEPNFNFSLRGGFFYKRFWRFSMHIFLVFSLGCQKFRKCCLPVER